MVTPSSVHLANFLASLATGHVSAQNHTASPSFSSLEIEIGEKLSDPEKGAAIRTAYEKHHASLSQVYDKFGSDLFQEWLVEVSKFLGSSAVDHMDLALRTFPPVLLNEFRQPNLYKERYNALQAFFTSLQQAWGETKKEVIQSPSGNQDDLLAVAAKMTKTVVVLYRTCGNGHLTASQGIKQFLEKKGYIVHLVNGGEFEGMTRLVNGINGNRTAVISSDMQELRMRVKPLHPDLIISTVAHHNSWTQLAYDLNVPSLVVHTDYEVHQAVVEDDGACKRSYMYDNSSLIQYCLPHEDNDANRDQIANNLSYARYHTLVQEVGFPLREPFERETDPSAIQALRKELGLRQDEKITLMLGHREPDTSTMIDLIRKLKSSTRSFAFPICIVAVCGDKIDARLKVEAALKTMPSHPDIRVKIEEYLDDKELAKYMKIASRVAPLPGVMVSKRGGSTTAEAVEMGVYTIGLPTKSQEECNGQYAAKHGLGELYNGALFVEQISKAIKWDGDRTKVYESPFKWKTRLLKLVETKIHESMQAKIGMFQFTTGNIL